jgi:hypothetical protein
MKANPINALLDECRAGKTSDEYNRSVERIDQKIASLQDERASSFRRLSPTAANPTSFIPRWRRSMSRP